MLIRCKSYMLIRYKSYMLIRYKSYMLIRCKSLNLYESGLPKNPRSLYGRFNPLIWSTLTTPEINSSLIPEHQFRFWFFQHSNYHYIKNLASHVYGKFYLRLKFCNVVIVFFRLNTVVGDYISTMKATFLFKFWPLTCFFQISKNSKSLRCGD